MKKLLFLFLFFVVSSYTYGQNVYFDTPNPGDVYHGRTYNSNATTGSAPMSYHILTVSLWFVVDWYGARIQYPDGIWGSWQDGQSGG